MTELKLKLPIEIDETNDGMVVTDAEESEFFFKFNQETGKYDYEGCCVVPQKMGIVVNELKSK